MQTEQARRGWLHTQLPRGCEKYIPQTQIIVRKQLHPWLDATCHEAVKQKNASEGTPDYEKARDSCALVLQNAYRVYRQELRLKISELLRGSKKWWALNRELLHKKGRTSSMPPLRHDGDWILDAATKASTLATTWYSKNTLPHGC